MSYSPRDLRHIYDRTSGYCHICWTKLSFGNYAKFGARGAWEVEHSNARAKGGGDHANNRYPACIPCNREKGTTTTRAARAWYGRTKAPLSREKRREARTVNTIGGAALGAAIGSLAGPGGAILGGLLGGLIGNKKNPDK